MIQFNGIKDAAERAFCNDEFYEFLTGRSGYELKVIDVPIDVPTDWTRIIPHGIYELYNETKNEEIVIKYQRAIKQALNGSYEDLWCAINVLFFQFSSEEKGKAPFLISHEITTGIKAFIIENKEAMEKVFPCGDGEMDMYSDIVRLHNNFVHRWGYGFLD